MVSKNNEPGKKGEGSIGAMALLMRARKFLSAENYEAFCNLVPNGDALYEDFKTKREESVVGLTHDDYIVAVLADNKVIDTAAILKDAGSSGV